MVGQFETMLQTTQTLEELRTVKIHDLRTSGVWTGSEIIWSDWIHQMIEAFYKSGKSFQKQYSLKYI